MANNNFTQSLGDNNDSTKELTKEQITEFYEDAMATTQGTGYNVNPETGEAHEYSYSVEPALNIRIWYNDFDEYMESTLTLAEALNLVDTLPDEHFRLYNAAGTIYHCTLDEVAQ